jgi:hypothetical protein
LPDFAGIHFNFADKTLFITMFHQRQSNKNNINSLREVAMKRGLSLIAAGLLSVTWLGHAEAKTYTRYEAHTPGGQKALASMRKAMTILKERGCKDPISWYYQGAMHWTPDVSSGTNLEQNPLCPSYTKSSPALSTGWDNCASHNPTGANSDIHFLPWHRMYLVYFENIIREVSGDPDFALPYWNYGSDYVMPKEFQAADGGSLYEKSRRISLNDGKSIDTSAQTTISGDLKQLSQIHDYKTFNDQLNFSLHGFMHDYIGGQDGTFNPVYNAVITKEIDPDCIGCGLMAEVPSAGFDPIFWLHHSNVDRLWQNFINANPQNNVTLAQLESVQWPYDFFKIEKTASDFTSTLVSLSMPEVLTDISTINYQYDQPALKAAAEAKPLLTKESALVSTEPKAEVKLNAPAKLHFGVPTTLKALVAEPSKSRVILELTASYKESSKGRYEVFVGLPANIAPTSKEAKEHYFAGAISFFVNDPQVKGGSHTFRYDITDELAAAKIDPKSFDVTIVKTYGPEKGVVTIEKATLQTLE